MDLKAKKRFSYRGRALRPGDPFQATRSHGRVLLATGQAEVGTVCIPIPKIVTKAPPAPKPGASPELQAAREAYTATTGKRFFSGWTVAQLRERIAAHTPAD